MKITEFRLGNLINFESQGIVKEKIIDIQWFIQNENNIDLHFWKPIQITDEFLLRLDTDFTIIKLERGVRVFNISFNNIEYVHQLQNLWIIFWNRELKILPE